MRPKQKKQNIENANKKTIKDNKEIKTSPSWM